MEVEREVIAILTVGTLAFSFFYIHIYIHIDISKCHHANDGLHVILVVKSLQTT